MSADIISTVLASLDDLKDEAAAHISPSELQKCLTSECTVKVASVRFGWPGGRSVPLFSREQVEAALREAVGAAPPTVEDQLVTDIPAESFATPHEIAEARRMHATDQVEIDDGAQASRGDDGLWVAAWVWIQMPT